MRKDIFIVGIRLLAIWVLIEAIYPLIYVIGSWFGYFIRNNYSQEYYLINAIVHLVVGLYLLLKTNGLFDFLERVLDKKEDTEEDNAA